MLLESEQLMHSFTWCDMADLGLNGTISGTCTNAADGGTAAVDAANVTRTVLTASDDGKVNRVDLREGKLRGAIVELYSQVILLVNQRRYHSLPPKKCSDMSKHASRIYRCLTPPPPPAPLPLPLLTPLATRFQTPHPTALPPPARP